MIRTSTGMKQMYRSVHFEYVLFLSAILICSCGRQFPEKQIKGIPNRSCVVWSFDDKWALLSIPAGTGKIPAGKIPAGMEKILGEMPVDYSRVWLTDGSLKIVRPVSSRQLSSFTYRTMCFSRDGTQAFYQKSDIGFGSYQLVRFRLDGSTQVDTMLDFGQNALLHFHAGLGGEYVFTRLSQSGYEQKYFRPGEEPVPLLRESPAVMIPYHIDSAHRDCVENGSALFQVRKTIKDNIELWKVPLGKAKCPIPDEEIKREPLLKKDEPVLGSTGRLLSGSPLEGKIRAYTIEGRDPNSIVLRFSTGAIIDGIQSDEYWIDRSTAVWVDPGKQCLLLGDAEGKPQIFIERLPSRDMTVFGYNESVGIACLEDSQNIYLVKTKTGAMNTLSKSSYGDGNVDKDQVSETKFQVIEREEAPTEKSVPVTKQ